MKNKLKPIQYAIDLWSIKLHGDVEKKRALLSPDELERADKLLKPLDTERFILGRGFMRTVLADYLDQDPATLQFDRNENGKPFLKSSGLEFNASHSRDHMLLAVTAGRAVGVDIEFHRENVKRDAIAKRWFSEEERAFLQPLENQEAVFFEIWSKKEAYVKAQGLGIYFDLPSFTVPLGEEPGVPILGTNGDYFLQTLEISPDCSAAIVSAAPIVPIRQRDAGSITIKVGRPCTSK